MQLLDHFKELTIHPKNAQELKGLILQLAIQGKLTKQWRKQNPDVEPAAVLLEKIQQEKAQLIKEKKIKKEKAFPEIEEDEIPYNLPETWSCCRLGEYSHYGALNKYENNDASENTWVLELEDIEKSSSKLLKKVRFNERDFKSTKSVFMKSDVVYGKLRPYLDKVIVADEDGVCTTEMIPIKSFSDSYAEYLLFLKHPSFIEYANGSTHGMRMPRMGTDVAKKAIVSIPPSLEQNAIVATVNQLFTEVEALEEQTKATVQLKQDFVTSALQQLATGNTVKEWSFLQEHFKTFFTEKSAVKKLRESILQLAVQGKLTKAWRARHPEFCEGSHSAAVLLEKIKAEKEQLIKEKKIKKEKPLPEITEEDIPYELPEGWVWCRMGDISAKLGAGSTPSGGKSAYIDEGIMFFRSQNIYNYYLKLEQVAFITDATHEKMKGTKVQPKDLLLNITGGSIGRCSLVPDNFDTANVSQHVAIVRMVELELRNYMHSLMISKQFQDTIMDVQVGVSREGLSMTKLKFFLVPLPSLKEQKAIVEKVNTLMGLCDNLEKEIAQSTTQVEQLMQSCLKEVFEG